MGLPAQGPARQNSAAFANPADVVLLHIGTNDINNGTQNPQDVIDVVDRIFAQNDKATVVLARIIRRNPDSGVTTSFNDGVVNLANARIANGAKIIIADLENALSYPADMAELLHPTQNGYDKMGARWFQMLEAFMPVCGSVKPLITSQPVTSASVGQTYTYDVDATANPLPTYMLTSAPAGMTIDANTGLISWKPATTGNFLYVALQVHPL